MAGVRTLKPTTEKTNSVCKEGSEESGGRTLYLNKFKEDETFSCPAGKRRNVSLPRGQCHASRRVRGCRHLAWRGDIEDVRGTYGRAGSLLARPTAIAETRCTTKPRKKLRNKASRIIKAAYYR
jgi:hypothetical protein